MKIKSFGLLLISVALNSSAFASKYTYSCDCIDTGLECDGGEKMVLKTGNPNIKITRTDKDGDFSQNYTAELDPTYKPRTQTSFLRFSATSQNSPYPYFLIQKGLTQGRKTGDLKAVEYINGEYGHTWVYECKLVK